MSCRSGGAFEGNQLIAGAARWAVEFALLSLEAFGLVGLLE